MSAETALLDESFAPYAEWILAVARAYTGGAAVTSTRRNAHEQAGLRARYLAGTGLPACRVGHSAHELGYAIDLVVPQGKGSAAQAWLGAVWNYYIAPTWSESDPVHFSTVRGCV